MVHGIRAAAVFDRNLAQPILIPDKKQILELVGLLCLTMEFRFNSRVCCLKLEQE